MPFIDYLIEKFRAISDWFWALYLEVVDWVWPFYLIAPFFYDIQRYLWLLTLDLRDLGEWIANAHAQIQNILSWDNIQSLITNWLRWLADPLYRFIYLWGDVWNEINSWWPTVWDTIQGWIAVATQGFTELVVAWDNFWNVTFPDLISSFDNLKAAWDNFWNVTFPTLVSFDWLTIWWQSRLTDIQALIHTAIQELTPFWEGWQDIRDQVLEFFNDPWGWLYDRFDDFIERFW